MAPTRHTVTRGRRPVAEPVAPAPTQVTVKSVRGIATTEFWVTALTIVGLVVGAIAATLPAKYAAIGTAVAAAAYAIARGLAKLNAPIAG
jgi:hypothetical protein